MSGDEAVTTSSLPREAKIINKLATAAYPSFALLTGMQLDIFTTIKDGLMSIKQIAEAIGVRCIARASRAKLLKRRGAITLYA